jgi:thiamine-phosphate pyrophosphorylase
MGILDLYAITDRKMLGKTSEAEAARICYEAGADVVQLRGKDMDGGLQLEQARLMQKAADEYNKIFIVDDRVDVAVLAHADGVHLGQTDIPLKEARKLTGDDMIIGISVTTVEEARKAVEDGADYLGVGSIFTTATKPDAKQGLGLDIIHDIKEQVGDVPLVAIGGINRGNILDVMRAGADGACVVSAIMNQPDLAKATHELKTMILNDRRQHGQI